MAKGMFVDTSICTGCKACQVACKEWNGLPGEPSHFHKVPNRPYPVAFNFTGNSYDNTGQALCNGLAPRPLHRAVQREPHRGTLALFERLLQALQ